MEPEKNGELIDLRRVFLTWMTNWYWFVISVAVCLLAAFVYVRVKRPVYEIRSSILINNDDKTASLGNIGLADLMGNKGKVDDEVYIVSSHGVLKDVVKTLGLDKSHSVEKGLFIDRFAYKDFPVTVRALPEISDTLRIAFRFKIEIGKDGAGEVSVFADGKKIGDFDFESLPRKISVPQGNFEISKTGFFKDGKPLKTSVDYIGIDEAAENLAEDLTFRIASKKSNVIEVGMKSSDIAYARDVLDNIVRLYNLRSVDRRNAEGQQTLRFIDSRLDLISGDLSVSESEVEQYKKNQRIIDVAAEAEYQTKKKSKTEESLIEGETYAEILLMTRDFLSQPSNEWQLIPTSVDSKPLQEAIKQYNELILKRMSLAKNAKDSNPRLRELSQQISLMKKNILSSLESAIRQQQVVVSEMRRQFGASESKLGKIPEQERRYRQILRQQSIKEQIYLFLLQRREETSIMLANATPKGVTIDEAYALKEPVSMRRRNVYLIALCLGLMIPPVVLFIRKKLRNRFSDRSELESLTSIPLIGEITKDDSGSNLVVGNKENSTIAELFRLVRSNLQFVLSNPDDKVILLTSTVSGEGKTFIAVNLAASLALMSKRVVLVGADIRKPRLANYLSLPQSRGLTDFVVDQSLKIDNILIKSHGNIPFDVVLSGPIPPNPSELLLSSRIDTLFSELCARYDYVIVDSAPVGMVSDTFSLARYAAATVYVCRADYTSVADIRYANRLHSEAKLPKMSIVLNGTKAKKFGYGYGYGEQ